MWSLKVRKVEQIKNEGLIFKGHSDILYLLQEDCENPRKRITMNYWSVMISKHDQTWVFFVSLLLEDLVKTHLRLTKKTTSPLKLSSKRWIQAWTQAWPLPPVKWLLRSQQWEKILPNNLVQRFFRFWRPLIRGIPEKIGQIKSLVGFEWLGFFHQKESDKKGKQGRFPEKVRDDANRMYS